MLFSTTVKGSTIEQAHDTVTELEEIEVCFRRSKEHAAEVRVALIVSLYFAIQGWLILQA